MNIQLYKYIISEIMILNITTLLLMLAKKNRLSYTNNYDTNNIDMDTIDTTDTTSSNCYIIEDNNYFWFDFGSGFISCVLGYILINYLCLRKRRLRNQSPIMAEMVDS